VPRAVLLDNRRELIVHASILPPAANAATASDFDLSRESLWFSVVTSGQNEPTNL
jgi:hypothetical protein